jgi:predicted DNA-binding transcriptional regulator AlpA
LEQLPYPPPWQDTPTLAQHICVSASTIENWVAQGILPAPRKRGGKLMWKWAEVDAWLTDGNPHGNTDQQATAITEAVKRISEEARRPQPYQSIFEGPNPPKRRR